MTGIDYRLEKFGSDCRSSDKVCTGRSNLRAVGWLAGTDLHPEYRVRRLFGDGGGD